jgi:hypothetical protein
MTRVLKAAKQAKSNRPAPVSPTPVPKETGKEVKKQAAKPGKPAKKKSRPSKE